MESERILRVTIECATSINSLSLLKFFAGSTRGRLM